MPVGDRVCVSGFGAFNVSTFRASSTDPKAAERVAWSKTTPYLKLPTVSSPAVVDGKLVFGDGMHQTDGAILHCLRADTGLPLWQLPCRARSSTWKARRPSRRAASTSAAGRPASCAWT